MKMVSNQQNSDSPNAQFAATKESPRVASLPEKIENPATGECMTILCSTRDSNGEYLLIRFDLPPGATAPPLHYHVSITETFEVLSGAIEIELGKKRKRKTLRPGKIVQVPPGLHHSVWNASDEWVAYTTLVRPAAEFEQFLRGLYGLARDGVRTNPLQFALLVEKSDTLLVSQPVFLQRLIFGVLTRIARLLRVEQSLAQYWLEADRREG
jgi:quercetin dioxygenase-like cupin family protein